MNIGISNHYPEQVSVPSIEVNPVEKSKKKWTDAENTQLSNYIKEFGENWKRVAEKMPGITDQQCMDHWISVLNPAIKHGKWTEEEDEQLKNLVTQHGENWTKIAKEISGRTNRQCRQRYKNTLKPAIKHEKWTEEEDQQLKNLVAQHGEKWTKIAKKMPGRTDTQCRQRYKLTLDPTIKREKWTEEENEQLKKLVNQHGQKWAMIAKEMSGRTENHCRHQYKRILKTPIKYKKWTDKEDNQLKEAVHRLGEGQWALISQEFSDITSEQCARHWKILNSKFNKKHSRSETNSSVEESPLKKFKKNHSPQLLDLAENEIPLNKQPTPLDQPQLILLNQAIPQHLEEPLDAIVVSSIVPQPLTYHHEPFITEHDLSSTDLTSQQVKQHVISNKINDFIIQKIQ